jgi:hypothetical protein
MNKKKYNQLHQELTKVLTKFNNSEKTWGIEVNIPTQRGMLADVFVWKGEVRFRYKQNSNVFSYAWNELDETTIIQVINRLKELK